jgi:hypothetical protein
MPRSTEPRIQPSEETIRSLAKKLEQYMNTVSEEERALLEHLLLTALPPLKRRALSPDTGILSDAEVALLNSLTHKE